MVAEITEQYLKIMYKLTENGGSAKTTDIASEMGVTPASVTEMLHKLASRGYIKHTAYKGAVLTPRGRRIARRMARKHRLLERFLCDVVGVRGSSGHEQACKMEHALSDEAERNLCKILNRPMECPHGRKIPKCDRPITCERCTEAHTSLADMGEGDTAVVSHVACENTDELCEMLAMGFVPGCRVKVEKKVAMGGPIIVSFKGTKVAIARERGKILHVTRTY
jgi:DtxR family Mn-dependent transcriptional regulator